MNPQRISGVSLILPRIRCHVRALEERCVGAWGLGAAYCARRMCPWNSKKERSSADVASRWTLPTLTLVFSIGRPAGVWACGSSHSPPGWRMRRLVVRYHPDCRRPAPRERAPSASRQGPVAYEAIQARRRAFATKKGRDSPGLAADPVTTESPTTHNERCTDQPHVPIDPPRN